MKSDTPLFLVERSQPKMEVIYDDSVLRYSSTGTIAGTLWSDNNNEVTALYSSSNESESNFNTSSMGNNETQVLLPIDMKFNDGHRLAIMVYSVLMVFSAFGNMTVLVTILRWRSKQKSLTTMNLLLAHLAIADLLVTLLMMPMEIAWNATVSWLGGDALCRILSFTRIFGLYLSGFVLMCISLDRYFAVVHPLSIGESWQRSRKMLTTAWIFSVLCSCPQPFIFHVESHPAFIWYEQCVTFNSFPNTDYELAYNFFVFTFLYGVPLATIVACYVRILWEIWKISSTRLTMSDESQLRRSTSTTIGRAKPRTLKMTVAIVLTFLLCWTPYHFMCIWYWLDKHSASQVDQRIQKGLFLFACTNSCMNPLIYGLFHFRGRQQTIHANHISVNIRECSVIGYRSSPSVLQPRSLALAVMTNEPRNQMWLNNHH